MNVLFSNNWIANEAMQVLGWTLFHSLWIGLLAAITAGVIINCTRRSTARLRYNLLTTIMIFFLLGCVYTLLVQIQNSNGATIELRENDTVISDQLILQEQNVSVNSKYFTEEFTRFFNTNANVIVLLWMIFFIIHCIKLLTGLAGVYRLRSSRTSLPEDEWVKKLNELSCKLGVHQSVSLLQSQWVKVPVVIGFLKPVILVPVSFLSNLPPDQVEAILLHELAHIRRRDYLINLLQRFTETIFFFNPAFIWFSSLIRQEREACCDDLVVGITGEKRNYLEALVSFQEFSVRSSGYAMAISSKQQYLLNRVKRLLNRENNKLNNMEKVLLLFGLIVFTAFTIIPDQVEVKQKKRIDAVALNHSLISDNYPMDLLEIPVIKIRDTTPAKNKIDENDFKRISTNVNISGDTKTETITAYDPAGKKYIITKVNDKLTSLQVDDKIIPENETGNYASAITQIEKVRAKNKQRKIKDAEAKRVESEKKKVAKEKKIIVENKTAASDKESEKIRQKIESKRKELDSDRKVLDQKRKEMSHVKKEISNKKQDLKSKEGKEKENGIKEIEHKKKLADAKLKDIEDTKKMIENKKQEIGVEKEKLEKIKEKEKENGDGEGSGKGPGIGSGKGAGVGAGKRARNWDNLNGKMLFKENSISLKQEVRPTRKTNMFKRNSDEKVSYEPIDHKAEPAWPIKPEAPGWKPAPSKKLFKKTRKENTPAEAR